MKVRYCVGPHKGEVVDMPTSSALAGIAAKQLEAVKTAEILPAPDKRAEPSSKNKRTRRG